jgi:HAD superfamily hydrolase (TIGR01509 family)
MIYWIFDMDETLYQITGRFSYESLKIDTELINLIKKLNGLKILFTNGTHQHTNIVLSKMGLASSFDLILDRNILGIMKPSPIAFMKLIKWCSITPNDTCYYFEDSIYNLIVGASLGWQTILINSSQNTQNKNNNNNNIIEFDFIKNGQKIKKSVVINYTFKNIKDSLRHFVNRMP